MTRDLEAKYGFAAQLSKLSDEQLVDRFNAEVGNPGWGNARMYFLHCLRDGLQRRSFDSSSVAISDGLRLGQQAELKDNKLVIVG